MSLYALSVSVVTLTGTSALETAARAQLPNALWREVFSRPAETAGAPSPTVHHQQQLGATLFNDRRLSGDQTRACSSCHQPDRGFTDGRARAHARQGSHATLRNTPTLYNLANNRVFNWDGSAATLETQALGPLQSQAELAADLAMVIATLQKDAQLRAAFAKAFPDTPEVSSITLTKALASYVRSLTAPLTRFDEWVDGKADAMTAQQQLGFRLFVGKAGCVACHHGWRFTDGGFHDIGLPLPSKAGDGDLSGKIGVRAFKTPTLRAVKKTGPYMHHGTLKTLDDVIDHYAKGVVARKGLSSALPRDLTLTAQEKAALVAFLKTL